MSISGYAWPAIVNFVAYKSDSVVPQSVTISRYSLNLNVGETAKIVATVKPDNAANKTVVWQSSDQNIATVASDGTVTAIADGVAVITAVSVSGAKSAICTVTVGSGKKTAPSAIIRADEMEVVATGGYIIGDLSSIGDIKYRHVNITPGMNTYDMSRIYTEFPSEYFSHDFTLVENRYVKVGYRASFENSSGTCQIDPMPYNAGKNTRLWG